MGPFYREEMVIFNRSEIAKMAMPNETPNEDFSAGFFAPEPIWIEAATGLLRSSFSAGETQVLLLRHPALPDPMEVHQVIEDRMTALPRYIQQDYTVVVEPFDISMGRCAVLQDAFGKRYCLLERMDYDLGIRPGDRKDAEVIRH